MSICCSCLSDRFPDDGGACVCQAGLPAANRIPGVRFRNPRCRPRKNAFSHDIAWHKHARPARLTSRHELKLSATFQEWGPRFPPDARVLFLKRIALVRTASAEERQSDNSGCRAKSGSAASGWLNGRLNASMAWLVPVASGKAAACHAALLAERHQC